MKLMGPDPRRLPLSSAAQVDAPFAAKPQSEGHFDQKRHHKCEHKPVRLEKEQRKP